MANLFKRAEKAYGGSAPLHTPYARAAQEWDDRIGSARVQARNWRLVAFSALALTGISLGAFVISASTTHIATYVVPVNEFGRPGKIALAGDVYNPSNAEISYFLADWVALVRGKSTDGIVIGDNWKKAYRFVTPQAEQTLSAYAKENDPFANVGKEARTVEVQSVLPRTKDTFQVTWREAVYTGGVPAPPVRWTGLFTVKIVPPKTEQQLRANPLGIYITSYQWSREL